MGIAAGREEIAQERFAMVGEELWAVRQYEARASRLADEAWGCAEAEEEESSDKEGAHEEEESSEPASTTQRQSYEEKAEEASAGQGLGEVGLW